MKKKCLIFLVFIASTFWLAPKAFADRRWYVWTYEYKTMEKGQAEVEYYLTFGTPDKGHFEGNTTTEHQLELEIGHTDRLDFAIYQVFEDEPGESIDYEGFKFRTRYKIAEKGQFILDPLLYLEYKGEPDFSKHGIEFKLILAKDVGKFNLALNPIFEFEREDDWEFQPGYAVGTSYEISPLLRLGLEAKGSEDGHYIGPVISHGRHNLWVTLGPAFEIADIEEGKPEFEIRMIVGIGF